MAFGEIDPIFRNAVAVWNPLEWRFENFGEVMGEILTGSLRRVFVRTFGRRTTAAVLSSPLILHWCQ